MLSPVKPVQVALVEPVAYQSQLARKLAKKALN
jgi:hypothetical protein